jgi:hypothetical protein
MLFLLQGQIPIQKVYFFIYLEEISHAWLQCYIMYCKKKSETIENIHMAAML